MRSVVKSAIQIGIWISSGRQPPSGFTFASWYSFIISTFCRSRSSGYFFLISSIFGWSFFIASALTIELWVSGSSTSFTETREQDDGHAPVAAEPWKNLRTVSSTLQMTAQKPKSTVRSRPGLRADRS